MTPVLCFVPPVPVREENYEGRKEERKSCHLNGFDENIELFLRTVICANQLSVYGAAADLCNELSEGFRASCGKNTLDDCMFLCLAMIETGNECQLSAKLLLLSNDAVVVGCTEVLFQPSCSL